MKRATYEIEDCLVGFSFIPSLEIKATKVVCVREQEEKKEKNPARANAKLLTLVLA